MLRTWYRAEPDARGTRHVKDGRAASFREYAGDQQGEDEFWSTGG